MPNHAPSTGQQGPKSSPKVAMARRQPPRAMEQGAGEPAEGSDAEQSRIWVDGAGETTSEARSRRCGASYAAGSPVLGA